MTLRCPRLRWNDLNGEGVMILPNGWRSQDWVTRADALKDWIYDLTQEYETTLAEFRDKRADN